MSENEILCGGGHWMKCPRCGFEYIAGSTIESTECPICKINKKTDGDMKDSDSIDPQPPLDEYRL